MESGMIIGIILLIAGFILVGVEMTIPGFGVPGISGIICLVVGIILTSATIEQGLLLTVIVIVILGIMLTIIMILLYSRKLKSPIILEEEVKVEKGFLNTSDLEYLINKEGVASTDLRPAGKGNFDGIELDIRSEGKYIQKGSKIKIAKVSGNVLIAVKIE